MPYKDPEKRRAYNAEWARRRYAENPAQFVERSAEWRKANPEATQTILRSFRERNRAVLAEKRRQYIIDNPDKIKEQNSAQYQKHRAKRLADAAKERLEHHDILDARSSAWRKANPSSHRASENRRRALKANPIWADQKAISDIYKECPLGMTVDHIIPLNGETIDGYLVSGLHVPWNLQFLTRSENSSKGYKMRRKDHDLCETITR